MSSGPRNPNVPAAGESAIGSLIESLQGGKSIQLPTRRIRDLLVIELVDGLSVVIATDSDGGIGPKPQDTVQVPGEVLGRFAVRVPLMEIFAAGAQPLVVIDALAVEMEPTGQTIIQGVRDELLDAGLDPDTILTGSTEDNVTTVATGMGVVIVALAASERLRPGNAQAGDVVAAVGLPKSAPGEYVHWTDPEIAHPKTVQALAGLPFVHDILPVGSKGIAWELNEMAASAELKAHLHEDTPVNVRKSAGPSTCVLAAMLAEEIDAVRTAVPSPVTIIGKLEKA